MPRIRNLLALALLLVGLLAVLPHSALAYTEDTQKIGGAYSMGRGQMIPPVDPMIVTSPFGFRIFDGKKEGHPGVDLAADYGTPIRAAAGGIVYVAGWNDGYGNAVAIDHGGNLFTLYGHNSELLVSAGDNVRQGQVIAYAGSTGRSTGPHCHFEVLPNGYWGDPVDPGLYFPGLMDLEREKGGGTSGGAPPQDAHGKHKDWTVAMDFAKPIRDATEMLTAVITKALGLLKSYVAWVFFLLVTIDLALGAMKKSMLGTDEDREGLFRWMVQRVLFYAMCLVLLFGWGDFVGNLSLHGFPALGALAGGDTYAQTAEAAVSDPTKVVQKGMNLVAPLINEAMSAHGLLDMLFKGPILIICLVAGLVLFFLFCLIGYQIAMAYIEFYLTILFSFTSFTFAGLKQVRQYASNGLNSVFACALNLMFFCLFAVMLQATMENMAVDSFISAHTVQAGSREELPHGMIGDKGTSATVDISGKPHADIAYLVHDILRSQYGKELRVDWIYAQLVHESANFTSYISRNYHNHAGMGYDGHGDYTRYGSDEEFARDYALTLSRYDVDGLFEAQTLVEYAAALRHGHYYTAPLEEYIHGLNAALNGGAFSTQSVLNLILLLKFILVTLMYMFFADRVSKFVLTQFGTSGFRLSREG